MTVPSPAVATAAEESNGRGAYEVADVVRAYGVEFVRTHPTSPAQRRVLRAIARCRTVFLGGHVEGCEGCGHKRIAYNSCLMGSTSFWGARPFWLAETPVRVCADSP